MKRFRRWAAFTLLAAGLCVLVAIPFFKSDILLGLHDNFARVSELIERDRPLALAIYLLVYVGAVALSFPGAALLTVIGGFGFGWLAGGAAAAVGATLGGALAFLAARALSRDWPRRLAGLDLTTPLHALRSDAPAYMLFLRLTPLFPFWLVNIAAALADVPLSTFVWTTLIGVLPGGLAFAATGEALGSVLEGQALLYRQCIASGAPNCRMRLGIMSMVDERLMIALAILGALALVPVAVRRIGPLTRFCERRGWLKPAARARP